MPLAYGRWDEKARAHAELSPAQKNAESAAALAGEVLVLAGELDSNPSPALAARIAELFPRGAVDVQPGGGHFPWLDDEACFAARIEHFLATGV